MLEKSTKVDRGDLEFHAFIPVTGMVDAAITSVCPGDVDIRS